jgi:hypothetical protein
MKELDDGMCVVRMILGADNLRIALHVERANQHVVIDTTSAVSKPLFFVGKVCFQLGFCGDVVDLEWLLRRFPPGSGLVTTNVLISFRYSSKANAIEESNMIGFFRVLFSMECLYPGCSQTGRGRDERR